MLDQNTDRMWYVIGAVIVGAAIIFIMNSTFPNLFGSIGETFKAKTEQTTAVTDGISPMKRNLIDYSTHELVYDRQLDEVTGQVIENPGADWYSIVGPIAVTEGRTYTFTAPKALTSPMIAYYGANGAYLGFYREQGEPIRYLTVTLPAGTTHVKLAAGDTRLKPERNVDTIENWEFTLGR